MSRLEFRFPNSNLLQTSPRLLAALLVFVAALQGFSESRAQPALPGRPVRVVSLSFRPGQTVDRIFKLVDTEGARGVDLIVLPETWRGQNDKSQEPIQGPTVQALAALAKKHRCYIVSPLDTRQGERRFNTAIVIDRTGRVSGHYDKAFPYWAEFDQKPPVSPGAGSKVIETDFGRIGLAICFDVNFPEVWRDLDDHGAEIVLWSSAYSAGAHLQAYSLVHHYYIVTATWTGDCQVYDVTGKRLLDEQSNDIQVSRITLDLDRGIYHQNFNESKRDKLLKEHAGEIVQEQFLPREQWFVLKALKPGVSARALAKQYGLEELRDYVQRSRAEINKLREEKGSAHPPKP